MMQKFFTADGEAQTKGALQDAKLGPEEMARAARLLRMYATRAQQALKDFVVMTRKLLAVLPRSSPVEEAASVKSSELPTDIEYPAKSRGEPGARRPD